MEAKTLAAELERLRASLSSAEWLRRNTEADEREALVVRVLRRREEGASELAAVREVFPDDGTCQGG